MRYKMHCIIAIVFFFMILILLYRFDTVNSFLALCFIISNLIIVLFLPKLNYLYVKFLISKKITDLIAENRFSK